MKLLRVGPAGTEAPVMSDRPCGFVALPPLTADIGTAMPVDGGTAGLRVPPPAIGHAR